MKTIELICINCPLGCPLTVTQEEDGTMHVTGNTCPRGESYAIKEITNPTRIVTSTVAVKGADVPRVAVKTREDIPKDKIFPCVRALKDVMAVAPVRIGDVILANVADTGVDIIATQNAG